MARGNQAVWWAFGEFQQNYQLGGHQLLATSCLIREDDAPTAGVVDVAMSRKPAHKQDEVSCGRIKTEIFINSGKVGGSRAAHNRRWIARLSTSRPGDSCMFSGVCECRSYETASATLCVPAAVSPPPRYCRHRGSAGHMHYLQD